jgi:hypothetical protein
LVARSPVLKAMLEETKEAKIHFDADCGDFLKMLYGYDLETTDEKRIVQVSPALFFCS